DESDIGRVASGQPVTFKVDAYPTQTFRGTVSQVRLEPKTDQNVVSYTTMIDVHNEDLKLKPGMTANVTVQTAMNENVLRVPNAALRFFFNETPTTDPRPTATSGQSEGGRGSGQRGSAAGGDRNFGRV